MSPTPPGPAPAAWCRRSILFAAGAVALVGCRRAAVPLDAGTALSAPVRLGWRWTPGMARAWRTTVTRHDGTLAASRTEAWHYLATDLAPTGIVSLAGRLRGVGATASRDGTPLPTQALLPLKTVDGPVDVDVGLRLNGRLTACSAEGFADALPHRLLGLHLPADPTAPTSAWEDAGLLGAFGAVLPADADPSVDARTVLDRVDADQGPVLAHLRHHAALRTAPMGPGVEITGTTVWDVAEGFPRSRHLQARMLGVEGPRLDIVVEALAAA